MTRLTPLAGALALAVLTCACSPPPAPGAPAPQAADAGRAAVAPTAAPAATSAAAPAPTSFYAEKFSRQASAAELTEAGRAAFFDAGLSASGQLSCASCHDPARAFGPPDARPVRSGGGDGRHPGLRAVPSLRYLQNLPPFTEHYYESDGDDSLDQGAAGGRTWDGRAPSAHAQAELPLLSEFEMANADRAAVVAKLRASPTAPRFRDTFGADVFDDEQRAWRALLLSLEVFQQSPAEFYPYSSRYDAWLRGDAHALGAPQQRGLKLFEAADKGNCIACHQSRIRDGAFPAFTDFGFVALGVPRNPKIPANADAQWIDLGLCGPLRTDLADHREYCGRFRTPSLRNVATRQVFFHNGIYGSLREVLRFYVQRDVKPQAIYGPGFARHRWDDLPQRYAENLNVDPPFGGQPGGKPALSDAEIDDVIAFLGALTDADLRGVR